MLPTQSAVVSGKGNRIIPRWRQISEKKERLSPQWELKPKHSTSCRPPLFLITHYLQVILRGKQENLEKMKSRPFFINKNFKIAEPDPHVMM
jgi:hypothetical protein